MRFIFEKLITLLSLVFLLLNSSEHLLAQPVAESNEYIPPRSEVRSGSPDIIWNPDGSLTVRNGSVIFQSGIKKYSNKEVDFERASEMLLVEESFIANGQKDKNLYNIKFDGNAAGDVSIGIWHRDVKAEKNEENNIKSKQFGFGSFDLSSDNVYDDAEENESERWATLLWGARSDNGSHINWNAYKWEGFFGRNKHYESDDFSRLYHKPSSWTWKGRSVVVGTVLLSVVAAVATGGASAELEAEATEAGGAAVEGSSSIIDVEMAPLRQAGGAYLRGEAKVAAANAAEEQALQARLALDAADKAENLKRARTTARMARNISGGVKSYGQMASRTSMASVFGAGTGLGATYTTTAFLATDEPKVRIVNYSNDGKNAAAYLNFISNNTSPQDFIELMGGGIASPAAQKLGILSAEYLFKEYISNTCKTGEIDEYGKILQSEGKTVRCLKVPSIPVVARMQVEAGNSDVTIKSVNIPGLPGRYDPYSDTGISPYRLFKNYYYITPNAGSKVIVRPRNGIVNEEPIIVEEVFDNINPEQVLPYQVFRTNGYMLIEPEGFTDDVASIYLVANKNEVESYTGKMTYNNASVRFDLGYYGQINGNDYHLYRFVPLLSSLSFKNGNAPFEFDADPTTGPFLAGDNIVFRTVSFDNVVVNNDLDQAVFKRSFDRDPTEDVELTVSGRTLISDGYDRAIPTSFDFGLYVGNKDIEGQPHQAKGVLTEDLAVLQSDQWILADYVFESGYEPLSLDYLHSYVQTNKHLPYVMGQEAVDKAGHYSITDMAMGQLRHLEELYLHAFDQEEHLEQQEARLLALKRRLENIPHTIDKKD